MRGSVPGLRRLRSVALACVTAILALSPARAGDRPGAFDFYVLALSWSPSYCEAEGDKRGDTQCARPFSFVVHGLWPQYEKGFPADCPSSAGRLPDRLIRDQLDIIPAFGLVIHQWRKHGTCSGLTAEAYFQAARRAFEKIEIPQEYRQPTEPKMVDVAAVERDFLAANKSLPADALAVTCDGRRLREVRVCLKRDLSSYTPCPEVDAGSCRRDRVFMPAIRTR